MKLLVFLQLWLCRWLLAEGVVVLLAAVFVACKPLVRQHVSDISAVSDARLTLGVVPIERSDSMHAYRMLLCKKAPSYPSSMLADDSRCRVALLDHNGAEVAFLPNEFKRDFATKYKGYAKGAVASFAIVPVALAAAYAGKWGYVRKIKAPKHGFLAQLHQGGLGENGWRYYKSAWDFEFAQHIKAVKRSKTDFEVRNGIAAIRSSADSLSLAAELKTIEDFKKLIDGYDDWTSDKKRKLYFEFLKEVSAAKNFMGEFSALKKEIVSDINSNYRLDYLEKIGKSFGRDISRYEQLHIRDYIFEKNMLGERFIPDNKIQSVLDKKMSEIKNTLYQRMDNKKRETDKIRQSGTIGFFAGAGLGAAIMLALDKSIWGYDERQVGKHWNQIFVENENFKDTRAVKDVMFILQALVDEFDFVVNARALQLAN